MTNATAGVAALSQSMGLCNFASGTYTGDAATGGVPVAIGFTPRYVKLVNVTDLLIYEYIEGLTDSGNDQTLLTTGSTGDVTIDEGSAVTTNASIVTATEMAQNAPGSQSADLGVNGTVTVSFVSIDQSANRMVFGSDAGSGGPANLNAKKYSWIAFG